MMKKNEKKVYLISNGDFRDSAGVVCWPKQEETLKAVQKAGVITWARFYEQFGEIGMDCGMGEVLALPDAEVSDRLRRTTAEWHIANVHISGCGRGQLMSSRMSNHITVGYGNILEELVATCLHLGIPTRVAGDH